MAHRLVGEERAYFVYILPSGERGTLYIGVTRDVVGRVGQHVAAKPVGFTKRYSVNRLVYFEAFNDIRAAIQCEKTMKKWPREWKINLIDRDNPHWLDLYPGLTR